MITSLGLSDFECGNLCGWYGQASAACSIAGMPSHVRSNRLRDRYQPRENLDWGRGYVSE